MSGSNPISEKCCPYQETDILSCPKLTPELCSELRELIKRHRCLITRRRRIHELSEPIRRCKRYRPKCPCTFKRQIELVREPPLRTRTEQLAMASVRRLLLFKSAYKHRFNDVRLEVINRQIRKSLLSVYSRLTKAEAPKPPVRIHKWTKEEWKKHRKYLKKLATPKKPVEAPKPAVRAVPFDELERYKELCLPKERPIEEKVEWHLKPEVKFYTASARILKMAHPVMRTDEAVIKSISWHISDSARAYKASKRIQELAIARDKRQVMSDIKENPFAIEPNALKYKASQRIQELAEPKEYDNTHIRDDPNVISPAALKAKASPRVVELAQPRQRN